MTIGIEHVNDYPLIRFDIRFERKLPIRRSLLVTVNTVQSAHGRAAQSKPRWHHCL